MSKKQTQVTIGNRDSFLLLLALLLSPVSESAEILGVFPIISISHRSFSQVIMKGLASKGHNITVLSYFPQSKDTENYTDIDLKGGSSTPNYIDSITVEDSKQLRGFLCFLHFLLFYPLEEILCNSVLSHPYMQDIIHSRRPRPDLMIVEILHAPCYLSVSKKFDIPTIGLVSALDMHGMDYIIANPVIPSYLPGTMSDKRLNMNFYERLINSVEFVMNYIANYWYVAKQTILIDQKYVGNKDVSIGQLHEKMDLVLYNSHFSILNRPNVPNAIEVGGIHIKPAQPLPKEIQTFIDDSEHGVIFFSFGSAIKASSFPAEVINMFIEVFSKIPQRIIWRCDALNTTDVPPNIMIGKWFPQRDILEHKNVKAFLNHGGIFGTFEAIYTEVPVVGIPFAFDQFLDINLLVEKQAAIRLDYDSLTHDVLLNALQAIVNDAKYSSNMRKLSKIFKDGPMSPLDTAIYWIEYVIRQKGAPHLRVKAADLPFYQYLLLDVICFVLVILVFVSYLLYFIVKLSLGSIFKYHNATVKLKKQL